MCTHICIFRIKQSRLYNKEYADFKSVLHIKAMEWGGGKAADLYEYHPCSVIQ